MYIEVVSITVVPYYTVITRDVPVERDCNTITVLLLLLFQINNQSINQSIAHTWQVLNDITGKRKKVNFVILLTLIVYRLMMPMKSVMHFCSYFANVGQKCSSSIGQATTHSSSYLKGNYENSLFLTPTTPGDIIAIVSSFKSKATSGHDDVSSKLVKDLNYVLSFPLSVIINNSLTMGRVPNMVKLAKIIPIYKTKGKKEHIKQSTNISFVGYF